MKFIQCNCLTKTPEPKYHRQNCPVWLAERVGNLETIISEYCEGLEELSQIKTKLRKSLERDGVASCNAMIHHSYKKSHTGEKCPICNDVL